VQRLGVIVIVAGGKGATTKLFIAKVHPALSLRVNVYVPAFKGCGILKEAVGELAGNVVTPVPLLVIV